MGEFLDRRNKLFSMLKENSAALIFSGVSKISSEDEFHPFCVNNHFFYLANIEQEHSVLLLVKGQSENKTYLFVDEYNELKEKWTGKRLTFDEAKSLSEVDNVYSYNQLDSMIALTLTPNGKQFGNIASLYMDLSPEIKIGDEISTKIYADTLKNTYKGIEILDVYPLVRDLRMVKSKYEVDCIVKGIRATNQGINFCLRNIKEGMHEYAVSAMFTYFGMTHGKRKLSFSTIVASGKNATCLHYPSQDCKIGINDMILFDLGYRDSGYCADISRTYPVNGVFHGLGKSIYEAVLTCNKSVIDFARTGMTIKDLQEHATEVLKAECIKRKLMEPDDDIRKYYFHNVSHHLGLDTHDTSVRERPLENGNVITVEPGLYFANFGIGVRIEDDVLFENGRAICLSTCIPKEIKDVERLFKTR